LIDELYSDLITKRKKTLRADSRKLSEISSKEEALKK